ncbi:MAG TPA: class I SAM-dependent methyltransferase [Candidatus Bilamarchaeaceae archaeon]|nr:class I SAM-dependent methyltransferase [Candidatus Bilamarchaeaceae archaeon]
MKANYPIGIEQQRYEAKRGMLREGAGRILRASGLQLEGIRTALDIGCRFGDTTLGTLEALPNAHVTGIDEFLHAILVAQMKFGKGTSGYTQREMNELLSQLPEGWLETFSRDAAPYTDRVALGKWNLASLHDCMRDEKVDLVTGFQVLHWLNADETGLPLTDIFRGIYDILAPGGIFIAGTSTAFMELDPNERVEGKTRREYSIDHHPYVQMVYTNIGDIVAGIVGNVAEPVLKKPLLSREGLERQLRNLALGIGFSDVRFGGFLVDAGRENVVNELVRIRPEHQGRLNDIWDPELRKRIIDTAITNSNLECDAWVAIRQRPDPRLVDTNTFDAVPFVIAKK